MDEAAKLSCTFGLRRRQVGTALQKTREIIEQILEELWSIQAAPFPKSGGGTIPEIPGWISAGNGDSLIINSAISELISELAGLLHTARPQLSNAISGKD
ncbi:MAG: hypothetical protein ACTHJU_15055 [Sphingopyxis sp.]